MLPYLSYCIFDFEVAIADGAFSTQPVHIAKMLQMETRPRQLVDPLFTPFQEAGGLGTFYVNLGNWDIQQHPAWYELPRGGIL